MIFLDGKKKKCVLEEARFPLLVSRVILSEWEYRV